jgi:hypothetical protein
MTCRGPNLTLTLTLTLTLSLTLALAVHFFVGLVEGGRLGIVWHVGGGEPSTDPAHLVRVRVRIRVRVRVRVRVPPTWQEEARRTATLANTTYMYAIGPICRCFPTEIHHCVWP